ncbi:DUF1707 domain-containing protein [Cryptosporangium sp. NPDC048952]|uniref:DUF1707 SHOCT-like domain-containing protein n=1 Tax=Cryptosporangium sp. NPDC048952 TaxID=3363961 RepID=UPI00371902A8
MDSDRPPVRASDKDRERVVELLRQHTSEGRLTIEEYEQRVETAYATKTVADLRPLLADLPVRLDEVLPGAEVAHPPAQVAWQREHPDRLARYALGGLALLLMVVALFAAARGVFAFWPLLLIGIFVFGGGSGGHRRHR